MLFIYFQNYKNPETGNAAFDRATVRNMDGLFHMVKERDYGFGAGLTTTKIGKKGYKTESGAVKALEKWSSNLTHGQVVYNQMATSRW